MSFVNHLADYQKASKGQKTYGRSLFIISEKQLEKAALVSFASFFDVLTTRHFSFNSLSTNNVYIHHARYILYMQGTKGIYIYVYENGNVATINSAKICISTTMGVNIYTLYRTPSYGGN